VKRILVALVLLSAGGSFFITGMAGGQAAIDAKQQALLKRLFPAATAFSPKGGDPPHFKAFAGPSSPGGPQTLLGLAFWTTELEPFERAYDGPIKILVGMDTKGLLTGVIVTEHHEPYGDFSVDRPEFAAQFRGKNIRDAFKVGVDIDAVSRATISVTSASRAVRNSARRVARQLLAPPEPAK
jgi:NosR/NirI family transcriptional regulator, nitrous oxide reductase regulator